MVHCDNCIMTRASWLCISVHSDCIMTGTQWLLHGNGLHVFVSWMIGLWKHTCLNTITAALLRGLRANCSSAFLSLPLWLSLWDNPVAVLIWFPARYIAESARSNNKNAALDCKAYLLGPGISSSTNISYCDSILHKICCLPIYSKY